MKINPERVAALACEPAFATAGLRASGEWAVAVVSELALVPHGAIEACALGGSEPGATSTRVSAATSTTEKGDISTRRS